MEKLILIDFDGTITSEDTNKKLVNKYKNEKITKYKKNNSSTEMNFMEYMTGLFSHINITEDEYERFIREEIELTEGYKDFYKECLKRNIPIGIVSGGFINGIEVFLEKHNIEESEIYANELDFTDDGIEISYYHGEENCCHVSGCGNCKVKHYEENKNDYEEIIFIGDGITDKPLAEVAEYVFAKKGLEEHCIENDIEYKPWNTFYDIIDEIF